MDTGKEADTSSRLSGDDHNLLAASADQVAPGVLVGVILGVLGAIGLLFSLAVLMDRWNRRLKVARGARGPGAMADGPDGILTRSTKIAILDDICPSPLSDPPAAERS